MYKNILVPVALDHNPEQGHAFEVAKRLLADGGTVTLLHVLEDIPSYAAQHLPPGQLEKNKIHAEERLQQEADAIAGAQVKVVTGHSGVTINNYASDNGCDLIVIASHRPGLSDFLLGSTAARVVRHAHCAVHVLR